MASGSSDTAGIDGRIGDCGLYEHGQRRAGRIPLGEAGNAARETDGFVWIGLQQPTADDLAELAEEFGLPALAVEDAVKAHQRPKVEVYGEVLFVVLKPVRYIDHDEIVEVAEIALCFDLVNNAADLVVGIGDIGGEDLGLAREQPLRVGGL